MLGVAIACGMTLLAVRRKGRFGLAAAPLLAITLALCRARGGMSRGLGYDVVVLSLAATLLAILIRSRPWSGAAATALVLALTTGAARHDPSFRAHPASSVTYPPEAATAAAYVRARTSPDQRIAVFNSTPGFYLLAHRRPATDSVFYYPWQAEWERRLPRSPDTCAQLRAVRPRFVFLFPFTIWDTFPFAGYAPCIDSLIRRDYRPVPDPGLGGMLWELNVASEPRATSPPR